MFGVKTARSVATERNRTEVLRGEVVLSAAEPAFVVVSGARRKSVVFENGTGEFFVRGKEEVFALAFETFGYFLVPFMTEKNLNVVLVEHAVPVEELIVCVARCAGA